MGSVTMGSVTMGSVTMGSVTPYLVQQSILWVLPLEHLLLGL